MSRIFGDSPQNETNFVPAPFFPFYFVFLVTLSRMETFVDRVCDSPRGDGNTAARSKNARFQPSVAVSMKSALLWDSANSRTVVPYRRFGTTYRSHLKGSTIQEDIRKIQKT
jgi:hypothetical protein